MNVGQGSNGEIDFRALEPDESNVVWGQRT
jgi:hypothetical protein